MERRLVVFSAAGQEYALPVERVREVVRWEEPRSLGDPEPWILGVVSLRGTLLRVADLALRLGLEPGPRRRIVIFDAPDGQAGLAVDEVDQVVTVGDEQLSPAPTARRDVVAEIAAIGSRLVVVLDPDGLLGPRPAPEPAPPPPTAAFEPVVPPASEPVASPPEPPEPPVEPPPSVAPVAPKPRRHTPRRPARRRLG